MTKGQDETRSGEIVVEEVFPHPPESVWKALTTPALMARWFRMTAVGFEPVVGNRFTFKTDAAGDWDGTIRCEVIEVIPSERFAYSWKGGNARNTGYGSLLDTVVTFTLESIDGGTKLRMVHSGFERPRNDTAYRNMSGGWSQVMRRLGDLTDKK
jgi:uncharacterized protein YndB with AHSA1/START domain